MSESVLYLLEYLVEKLELDTYLSSRPCCDTRAIASIAVLATLNIVSAKLELGWELEADEYRERKLLSRLTVADREDL